MTWPLKSIKIAVVVFYYIEKSTVLCWIGVYMEKKKTGMGSVYAILGLFIFLVIGLVVFMNMKNNLSGGGVVEICDGRIVEGNEAWGNFMVKSKAGRSTRIKFKFTSDLGGDSSSAILKFSDGKYTYKDKNGNKYSDKVLLDLSGKDPLTEKNARYICLADGDYTFNQIASGGEKADSCTILISLSAEQVVPAAR